MGEKILIVHNFDLIREPFCNMWEGLILILHDTKQL